jgi:CMP-N-acetylneuraminic acid synthetase
MKIAALLTGKKKSTLKNKNILPVKGKPLAYYPALAARNSKLTQRFFVSSDSEKLLETAHDIGYDKIRRLDELCQPDSKHVDVINHALHHMEHVDNYKPDILIVLLANTVTIKTEWIDNGIQAILDDPTISAVVPVYNDQDHHPFRAKRLNASGFLDTFFDFKRKQMSTNRQELEPCYFLCHNFWVLNLPISIFSETGQQPWSFMGKKVKPFFVDECFDVHDMNDLIQCEKWLEEKGSS